MNENAMDCIEAMRPQEATHMETVRIVSFDQEAGSDSGTSGMGNESAYDRYAGETPSTTRSSTRKEYK